MAKTTLFLLCLLASFSFTFAQDWQLVWQDEFEQAGLPDSSRWSYDLGDGCPHLCGWGNNELQSYTDHSKNARVENGHLIIEAHKEQTHNSAFSSARLVSKGKGDWLNGRVEVRANLPRGKGTWAAIWMLPTTASYGIWPASGEIDIMEHVGFEADTVHGTIHSLAFNWLKGTDKSGSIYLPDAEQAFHVYAIEWSEEKIDFFVDNTLYFTFLHTGKGFEEWPFDQPFHLILNLAIGGNWGGQRGIAEGIWPQRMEIDYVRVYQKKEHAVDEYPADNAIDKK